MNDMRWPNKSTDGGVVVKDSVRAPRPLSGEALRSSYFDTTAALTLGLVKFRDETLRLGPWELLRFGPPATDSQSVYWPIQGGLLAAGPGGRFEVSSRDGRLAAKVDGYRPALPLPVYALTQLPVHHALVRLQLLRLRGRQPSAGVPANVSGRLAAAAIDAALCAGIALALARKRRLTALLAVAAGYHVAAWSVSGRTVGGAIMRQRVVAVDGSRPSLAQAALRFAFLPLAAFRMRAVHDEIAATDVISE
jgi:RDD family